MIVARRGFLLGLGSLLAAPAIVHASNLMPISSARIIAPTEYDMLVITGVDQYGLSVEEKIFNVDAWNEATDLRPGFVIKKLRSISRPWEQDDYGLRDDLIAAFKEHGG